MRRRPIIRHRLWLYLRSERQAVSFEDLYLFAWGKETLRPGWLGCLRKEISRLKAMLPYGSILVVSKYGYCWTPVSGLDKMGDPLGTVRDHKNPPGVYMPQMRRPQ